MSNATAAKKKSAELEEILNVRGQATPTRKQKEEVEAKDSRFANIDTNTFFQTVFDESLSPEEKQKSVTKLLTFQGTKEENRERVKAFDLFKEYLQSEREAMATQIIKMSDTKNFAVLKEVFEDINNSLIQFEDDMEPLVDIIDALHELRSENQTLDAFREIKDDEERQKKIEAREQEIDGMIEGVQETIADLKAKNRVNSTKKKFFGMGGITDEAQMEIAKNQTYIEMRLQDLEKYQEDKEKLKTEDVPESKIKNTEAKQKLKEMLDLASEEHQERSEKLISSAVSFVETSKDKIETIRDHLGKMSDQTRNLDDANGQMSFIYAIIGEGVKDAEDQNKILRDQLSQKKEDENMVEKLTRENKQRDMDEHIQMLEISAVDTTATVADLTSASIRIKNMIDANQQQSQMARDMHSRGVAGVADRLSTVINAIGSAAIAESNAMTGETLSAMSNNTDVIAQKESMRLALGLDDRNQDVMKAIDSLAQYGEVNRAATEYTKKGLSEMRENLRILEETAGEVADTVRDSKSAYADIVMGEEESEAEDRVNSKATKNPFNL